MKAFRSRLPETALTSTRHRAATLHAHLTSTSSPRSAATSAPSCWPRPARRTCCPTSTCSPRRRCRSSRWRGRRADHAGLEQLPRPDRRRARAWRAAEDALHRYGTGLTGSRLLNGTIPLHLELEREIAEWMDTEDALVFSTGHQANVGTLGTLLGSGRHRHRRLRRPRLDPRRLPALARQAAPLPPQPPGQAREDARARGGRRRRACWWSSTASSRWRATSRRCRRSPSCASATAPA